MASHLDPSQTALLLLDLQVGILTRIPAALGDAVIEKAESAIAVARKHGVQVAFIRVALDESDVSNVPDHVASFAAAKLNKEVAAALHPDSPATQIHHAIAPLDGDMVHRKIRFGPFMREPSSQLLTDFKRKGIRNVVVGGISTSGAVLSSVRQLADLDYHVTVLEDCCADSDADVHSVLVAKVFPKQARVIKSFELEELFEA